MPNSDSPAGAPAGLVLYTRAEAAHILRTTVKTMERWAQRGIGPRYSVVLGRALYPDAELRRVSTPAEAA